MTDEENIKNDEKLINEIENEIENENVIEITKINNNSPSNNSLSSDDIIIEVNTNNNINRFNTSTDLILSPSNDDDKINNLNLMLIMRKKSIKFDSECFEEMYEKTLWIIKITTIIKYSISFIIFVLSGLGVIKSKDLQEYILAFITFLIGLYGYNDHNKLQENITSLYQCVEFTNDIYDDINYFLFRSNHNLEALNIYIESIDDKLKMFDRNTRVNIPSKIKNKILDNNKIKDDDSSTHQKQIFIYKNKNKKSKTKKVKEKVKEKSKRKK